MKVLLSGFNLDIETLRELQSFIREVAAGLNPETFTAKDSSAQQDLLTNLYREAQNLLERDNLTPETLSAAYARISRDPRPIYQLREVARREVERARKSNRNIIFGLGHSSVAEHAVFNFDMIGLSRLAVETIEHFRLASFTEKSQRYILFEDDYVVPAELPDSPLRDAYRSLIQEQYRAYHRIYRKLRPYFFEKYQEAAREKKNHRMIEGLAKEDARYIIPLATQTQLGMTVNARSLEHIISACAAHPLEEVREAADQLYRVTEGYAPSIIKYTEPTPYRLRTADHLRRAVAELLPEAPGAPEEEVRVLDVSDNPDTRVAAAVLFHHGGVPFERARQKARELTSVELEKIYRLMFRDLNVWDSVLREFELVDISFELTVSASNFGQLKRHRMATLIAQDYDPALGITVPDSIRDTGQEPFFREIIEKTESVYRNLQQVSPFLAPYVLTNAHRRRVLFKLNLREFYHFSRLREDQHAQWDIRRTAREMRRRVQQNFPLAGALLSGKDRFADSYQKFFRA